MELTKEQKKSIRTLKFPGEMEAEFRREFLKKSLPAYRWLLPLIVVMFASFALLDWISFNHFLKEILIIRFIGAAFILAVTLVSYFKIFEKISQSALTIASIVSGSCINAIIAVSDNSDPGSDFYFAALALVFMGAFVALRLRVVNAHWVTIFVMIGYEYVAIQHQGLLSSAGKFSIFLITNFILAGTSMLGLITCFNLEVSARRDFLQQRLLEEEHQKAEALLLNIFPENISKRLKLSSDTIADGFENVTVVFADIANFTNLAQRITPEYLVEFLNRIFSMFDDLVEKHGLEKIKTIGDAYMIASGLPDHREDHAVAAARLSLEMMQIARRFKLESTGEGLTLRIGINSGPVVAGVIGKKRFIYDLWGDAVNLASRMESHGIPGEIQISRETYELVKDKFETEERGIIHVKGKGDIMVYFLRREK